jgi:hypothetical protein
MTDVSPDAKKWLVTAGVFRQLAESIHPTDWRPQVDHIGTPFPDEDQRHSIRQQILETYPPVLQECISVLAGWFETRERKLPDKISQEARYWIYQMACQISAFCESHVCQSVPSHPPSTIIPYPNMKEPEVCEWLIGEWWGEVGLRRCIAQSTTDQSLFWSENV